MWVHPLSRSQNTADFVLRCSYFPYSFYGDLADPAPQLPYTRVNKCIRLFPKLQGNMHLLPNMHLIMKAKIDHTPKPRRPFGSTCTWQKSWVVQSSILYCCNSLAMKTLSEKLISWNRHCTQFRLSGVGSPCWLGVHHGLPKECELWCHDKRWFLSWWEQLM